MRRCLNEIAPPRQLNRWVENDMSPRIAIALGFLILLASSSYAQKLKGRGESYQKGKTEAAQDIKKNVYIVKGWGLALSNLYPWPSREEVYESILQEKYKITFELVGGCVVDNETADYVDGYDAVAIAAIESRWGKGLLESVRRQSNAEYEQKYGDKEREYNKNFVDAIKSLPKKDPK